MSTTIWIDLTDMIGWSGQHGGTQRVVYGIAEEYYLAAKKDAAMSVKFFLFDERSEKFFVTSFDPLREQYALTTQEVESSATTAAPSKKQLIKHMAVRYSPGFVKNNPRVRKNLLRVAKKGYHGAKKLRDTVAGARRGVILETKGEEAAFKHNDVVLLLGKPWDSPKMTPALTRLKEAQNFTVVAIIYDLVISLYPHLHSPLLFKVYTQYMFDIAQCADLVLPISKSSEKDFYTFCDKLQLPKPKSKVIRIADTISAVKPKKPQLPNDFSTVPFVLCVGTVEVRKNHSLLYYAYKLAKERNINLPKLIIVGRKGWHATDIYNMIKNDKEVSINMLILESVSDSELEWLYDNCELTVYPSMYEGWGLPVAESMQHGKIVVASKSSSIPEIAGELLEYHSPYSVDEFLHLLIKYLESPRKEALERVIKEKYSRTKWVDTYRSIQKELSRN